jgi:hypothetical protein
MIYEYVFMFLGYGFGRTGGWGKMVGLGKMIMMSSELYSLRIKHWKYKL